MLSKSRVKYIQSLYHKKFRDQYGVFIIEGPKIVKEFLQLAPAMFEQVYALQEWIENNGSLLGEIESHRVEAVQEHELQKISSLSTSNMVLAVVKKKQNVAFAGEGRFSLMLDDIQDPGNMGTIIRTADWFGIHDIICSKACADIYNPKVVQSTMGSILRVNILYEDLPLWYAQQQHIPLYAAALGGQLLQQVLLPPAGILLIGNESKGVSEALLRLATEKIMIPRAGAAESLNAAVAAGIILWHIAGTRQYSSV